MICLVVVLFVVCDFAQATIARGTRCYGVLGCLELNSEWYNPWLRPFNSFPESREALHTSFVFYTINTIEGQKLMAEVDEEIVNIDPKRKTIIIVHGYLDNRRSSSWIKEMRLELLKREDMNVIEVDWGKGSCSSYLQVTANTRLVALEMIYLISNLKKKYLLDPANVHIVGHSLGAHVAGYVGQNITGLGRITGVDPARPYFEGMPETVRLDPSDADFVDVIHTDGAIIGFGMIEPCGHVDFYPHGGKNQPNCGLIDRLTPMILNNQNLEEAARAAVACNHNRAIRLFIESINGHCKFLGHPCRDQETFLKGECFTSEGGGAAEMGLRARRGDNSFGTKYFLLTGEQSPYCRYLYKVNVSLARPSKAEKIVEGEIKITLHGDKTTREANLTPSGPKEFVHGRSYVYLTTDTVDTGPVHKADIRWRENTAVLFPLDCLFTTFAQELNGFLYVRDVTVDVTSTPSTEGENVTNLLCPMKSEYGEIPSHGYVTFSKDFCAE